MAFHDWNNRYNKLLEGKRQFGHANVIESYSDTQLQNGLVYQRKLCRKGKLFHYKIEKLKSVGVEIKNKTLNQWEDMNEQLVQLKKEHGHLYVCSSFGAGKELINFIKVLRRSQGTLQEKRIELRSDLVGTLEIRLQGAVVLFTAIWNLLHTHH